MQIVQELCKRPGLNKCGFDMPTIYIPNPNKVKVILLSHLSAFLTLSTHTQFTSCYRLLFRRKTILLFVFLLSAKPLRQPD